MASTEVLLRDVIKNGLIDIGVTKLGFDAGYVNVKDYLIEHEIKENISTYLNSQVNGKKTVRCVAVWVTGSDKFFSMGGIIERSYEVLIYQYYEKSVDGVSVKALLSGANSIREMLTQTLLVDLTGLVDRTDPISAVSIRTRPSVGSKNELLEGLTRFTAYKRNATFV